MLRLVLGATLSDVGSIEKAILEGRGFKPNFFDNLPTFNPNYGNRI